MTTQAIDNRISDLGAAIARLYAEPDTSEARKMALEAWRKDIGNGSLQAHYVALMEDFSEIREPIEDIFQDLLKDALRSASEAGKISPIKGPAGNTVIEDAWQELTKAGWDALPDYRRDDMSGYIAKSLRNHVFDSGARPDLAPDLLAAELAKAVASGTMPGAILGGEGFTNFANGKRLRFTLRGWSLLLQEQQEDGSLAPPQQMPHGRLFHAPVDIPSGRLLIADEISIGELRSATHAMRTHFGLELNYASHRVMNTLCSSALYGLVDVSCASDAPPVIQDRCNGALYVARPEEGFELRAHPVRDLWSTQMIDFDHMVAFLCRRGRSEAQAKLEIESWLDASESHCDIIVAPGTWHLYWDDDRETLSGACIGGAPAPAESRLLLSPEALEFNVPVRDLGEVYSKLRPT